MTPEEINWAVARDLGWKQNADGHWSRTDPSGGEVLKWRDFDYCRDIKAAWEIMDQCIGGVRKTMAPDPFRTVYEAKLGKGGSVAFVEDETAPMALCLAFLKLKKG